MHNEYSTDDFTLWTSQHFVIEQCWSCPVPGYVIIFPQEHVASLAELNQEALQKFGPVCAWAERIIKDIVQVNKVYLIACGEQLAQLHFHLFPRTDYILQQYQQAQGIEDKNAIISGPLLFDWARAHINQHPNYDELMGYLKIAFAKEPQIG